MHLPPSHAPQQSLPALLHNEDTMTSIHKPFQLLSLPVSFDRRNEGGWMMGVLA
jgi:hypothetical protein